MYVSTKIHGTESYKYFSRKKKLRKQLFTYNGMPFFLDAKAMELRTFWKQLKCP